jgi:uncharacterized protein (TIGR02246 family)
MLPEGEPMRVALIVAALAAPTLGFAQTSSIPPLRLNGAITAVADAYVKATLSGNAAAIAALYDKDAVEMPPNQPLMRGTTQIEQYYKKLFSGTEKVTVFRLNHIEAVVSGDIAYDVGTYRQTVSVPSGKPVEDTGKFTVLLRRQGNGEWKVTYSIYNSDLAAPPAPAGTRP